jgi:hypothetical protein
MVGLSISSGTLGLLSLGRNGGAVFLLPDQLVDQTLLFRWFDILGKRLPLA